MAVLTNTALNDVVELGEVKHLEVGTAHRMAKTLCSVQLRKGLDPIF